MSDTSTHFNSPPKAVSKRFSRLRSGTVRCALLAFGMAGLSGCGMFGKRIHAYERQIMSHRGMEFIENPIEEMSVQHMLNAREGSVGGFGGSGGGCGCN